MRIIDVRDPRGSRRLAEWVAAGPFTEIPLAEGKRAALIAAGAALGFPASYGRNLDALSDCLRDLAAGLGEERLRVLWHVHAKDLDEPWLRAVREIAAEAETASGGALSMLGVVSG